mgnify:CR=1 FL=1
MKPRIDCILGFPHSAICILLVSTPKKDRLPCLRNIKRSLVSAPKKILIIRVEIRGVFRKGQGLRCPPPPAFEKRGRGGGEKWREIDKKTKIMKNVKIFPHFCPILTWEEGGSDNKIDVFICPWLQFKSSVGCYVHILA